MNIPTANGLTIDLSLKDIRRNDYHRHNQDQRYHNNSSSDNSQLDPPSQLQETPLKIVIGEDIEEASQPYQLPELTIAKQSSNGNGNFARSITSTQDEKLPDITDSQAGQIVPYRQRTYLPKPTIFIQNIDFKAFPEQQEDLFDSDKVEKGKKKTSKKRKQQEIDKAGTGIALIQKDQLIKALFYQKEQADITPQNEEAQEEVKMPYFSKKTQNYDKDLLLSDDQSLSDSVENSNSVFNNTVEDPLNANFFNSPGLTKGINGKDFSGNNGRIQQNNYLQVFLYENNLESHQGQLLSLQPEIRNERKGQSKQKDSSAKRSDDDSVSSDSSSNQEYSICKSKRQSDVNSFVRSKFYKPRLVDSSRRIGDVKTAVSGNNLKISSIQEQNYNVQLTEDNILTPSRRANIQQNLTNDNGPDFTFFLPNRQILIFQDMEQKEQDLEIILDNSNRNLIHQIENQDQKDLGSERKVHSLTVPINQEEEYSTTELEESQEWFGCSGYSLWIFGPDNRFRKIICLIIDSQYFEHSMTALIVLNSFALALHDFSDRESLTLWNQVLEKFISCFTYLFFIEAFLKILAHGVILDDGSYLRNRWNLFDAVVIIVSILELTFETRNLRTLRVFRILRPLKSITAIKSMRTLLQALIKSIPEFVNVLLFLLYIFIFFALIGLHLYNGKFYNACRINPQPELQTSWIADVSGNKLCSVSGLGMYDCPVGQYCRNPSDNITYMYQFENMQDREFVNFGITNFDNIGRSLLTIFQIIMTDTAFQTVSNLIDVDMPFFGGLYGAVIIIVGQFFLTNLFIAVIIFSFIKSQKNEVAAELREYQLKKQLNLQLNQSNDQTLSRGRRRRKTSKKKIHSIADAAKQIQKNMRQQSIIKIKAEGISDSNQADNSNKRSLKRPKSALNLENLSGSVSKKTELANQACSQANQVANDHQKHIKALLKVKAQERRIASILQTGKSEITQQNEDSPLPQEPLRKKVLLIPRKRSLYPRNKDSTQSAMPYLQDDPQQQEPYFHDDILSKGQRMTNETPPKKLEELKILHFFNQEIDQQIIDNGSDQNRLPGENDLKMQINDLDSVKNQSQPAEFSSVNSLVLSPNYEQSSPPKIILKSKDLNEQVDQLPPAQVLPDNHNFGHIEVKLQRGISIPFSNVSSAFIQNEMDIQQREMDQKKLDLEYEKYFNVLLKDAGNIEGSETKMQDVVGIKAGLDFIQDMQAERRWNEEFNREIQERNNRHRLYSLAYKIDNSLTYIFWINFCIIMNTIVLSLDKYPIDTQQLQNLEIYNFCFTAMFTLEFLIKLLGHGFKQFFKGQWFNIFDTLIVAACLIDILISEVFLKDQQNDTKMGSVFTALRGFRLLRIFKLAKSWKRFQLLLETMAKTLKQVATISILLILFVFIFTLLGQELFAYRVKLDPSTNYVDLEKGTSPDLNFDNFLNAFSTVFIVLTNDRTLEVYFNLYRSVGPIQSTIYMVLLIVLGQKVILNLFVAVLLENFDESTLKQKMFQIEQVHAENRKEANFTQRIKQMSIRLQIRFSNLGQKMIKNKCLKYFVFDCICKPKEQLLEKIIQSQSFPDDESIGPLSQASQHKQIIKASKASNTKSADIIQQGKPLFIIPKDLKMRVRLEKIFKSKTYEFCMIVIIIINSVQLALDNNLLDPKSMLAIGLFHIDWTTRTIFIMEAILKILTFGFLYNGPESYLRQKWDRLDFIILILSILSISLENYHEDFKALKIFRVLRLISRNESLKIAVLALFKGIPNIFNVTIIMLLFFLIFGVISVSQFKGLFFHCTQEQDTGMTINSKWECFDSGGEWVNQDYNFDNIPNAMLTFFVMSTSAGWSNVMIQSITSTQIDYVASSERSIVWTLYYFLFMIIGFFFFLNLFIGVVITNFNSEKDKIGGNDLLTDNQRQWIDHKLLVLRCAPIKKVKPPNNCFRLFFFNLMHSRLFQIFIGISIFCNSICLTIKWYQEPVQVNQTMCWINNGFVVIFALETIVKLIGLGWKQYFSEGWRIYEFTISSLSLLSLILYSLPHHKITGIYEICFSIKLLIFLRLLRYGGRQLQMIFNTFVIALQQLVNIGALLLLIIFMYSVLGMILFGNNMRKDMMNDHINFENIVNSFFTLFTVTTGDSWDGIQQQFSVEPSILTQCLESPSYQDYVEAGFKTVGCRHRVDSFLFFTSYYFIVGMVFLQLFIAVILQGYEQTQIQSSRPFNGYITNKFRRVWSEFDPNATTYIKLYQLREFLKQLGGPLGFDDETIKKRTEQDKFIAQLDLPIYSNFSEFQFLDILEALSLRVIIKEQQSKDPNNQQNQIPKTDQVGEANTACQGTPDIKRQAEDDQAHSVLQVKVKITKELNRLLFQQDSENIHSLQEVLSKERRYRVCQSGDQAEGLTSVHMIAAQNAVVKFKKMLRKRREERQRIDIIVQGKNLNDIESQLEKSKLLRTLSRGGGQHSSMPELHNKDTAKFLLTNIQGDLERKEDDQGLDKAIKHTNQERNAAHNLINNSNEDKQMAESQTEDIVQFKAKRRPTLTRKMSHYLLYPKR